MNYARRQHFRRLPCRQARAGRHDDRPLGMLLLSIGLVLLGSLPLALAVIIGFRAHHWLSLAGRSRVGARSEDAVRHALGSLREHGSRLRHGVRWQGGGDIDSVAIAPTGVGFAIET